MNEFVVVLVTVPSQEEAGKIARALIDSGASPCINVVPSMTSIYRWEGALRSDQECLMLIKSRRDLFSRVREIVESLHSYEVPEVIAVPLAELSGKYGSYLAEYFETST